MEIYEAGKPIGTITAENLGLFWGICCKITDRPELLRRIFAQEGWTVEYLGIPDSCGELRRKIPQKYLPNGIATALATSQPRDQWRPWRGELDGVQVENAFMRRDEKGIELALYGEDTVKFPALTELMKRERVFAQEMAILSLGPEGQLPVIEREMGGNTDETMDCGNIDFELSAEPAAPDGDGCGRDEKQGWETDCSDL